MNLDVFLDADEYAAAATKMPRHPFPTSPEVFEYTLSALAVEHMASLSSR
jgi:hypothetical protein